MSERATPVDDVVAAPHPLLVCDDADIVDAVLHLAAVAGVSVELQPTPGAARSAWRRAPLILVGPDAVPDVARLRMSRRNDVIVVCLDDDERLLKESMLIGAERVCVITKAQSWLTGRMAEAVESSSDPGDVVCVVGGRGGAGASTTAAALALTAMHMGRSPLLIDGDPLGGGIDLVLGGEDSEGLRWPDLTNTRGRVNGTALRAALPQLERLTVLSWDRSDTLDIPAAAMRAVLSAAARVSDLVVVDLPRRVDEAAAEALARSTVTLLVVPAEVRAVAAASRVATGIREHAADVRVLVRGPAPTGLSAGIVVNALSLPAAGQVRAEPHLATALDNGDPPFKRIHGPLSKFCQKFLLSLDSERRAA